MSFSYFPFFEKFIVILNNILNFLLKVVIILSGFFIIYLGIKFYFSAKNLKDAKQAFLYIILGLILVGLVFLNKNIILKTIEYFVPTFK